MDRGYVDVSRAAELLGYAPGAVSLLCRQGKLEGCFKDGREWRIPLSAVLAYEPLPRGFAGAAVARKRRRDRYRLGTGAAGDAELAERMEALCSAVSETVKRAGPNLGLIEGYGILHALRELERMMEGFSPAAIERFPKLGRPEFIRPLRERATRLDGTADGTELERLLSNHGGLLRKRFDLFARIAELLKNR